MEILWYLIVIVALICYAMLDGFDLGVGALHLMTREDKERRLFLNSIGPLWDGNEVWLVIVLGGLFAGFPDVFAALLSGFYNVVMLLIASLIFRAVAIEFRSKREGKLWRGTWDLLFAFSSILIAFGIGLVLGNLIMGVPLDQHKDFVGTFSDLFRPYPILLGLTVMALFAMHGAIYLSMKIEGELHRKLRPWINRAIVIFIFFYAITTVVTIFTLPHMIDRMVTTPWLLLIPLAAFAAVVAIPWQVRRNRDGVAFLFSCLTIAFLLILFAIGTYPVMIRSSVEPALYSLTIANSASSPLTLKILLIIVAIGLPFVFAYGFYLYRVFRGKVRLDEHSY